MKVSAKRLRSTSPEHLSSIGKDEGPLVECIEAPPEIESVDLENPELRFWLFQRTKGLLLWNQGAAMKVDTERVLWIC